MPHSPQTGSTLSPMVNKQATPIKALKSQKGVAFSTIDEAFQKAEYSASPNVEKKKLSSDKVFDMNKVKLQSGSFRIAKSKFAEK